MNTTEKIVEAYFRICMSCFTIPDIKVIHGNNRQIDLLAYHVLSKTEYHVEVSVTHGVRWCPTPAKLRSMFDRKFFGIPPKRAGENTDYAKGKSYSDAIFQTYKRYGLTSNKIKRVWVSWTIREPENLEHIMREYMRVHGIAENPISLISFRDQIMPELLEAVSTAHYEDDALRTFSLLRQYQKQSGRE